MSSSWIETMADESAAGETSRMRSSEAPRASLARSVPDRHAIIAALSGSVDVSDWTCREVLFWFVDHNWLLLLDDFKDVSGAHLLSLPAAEWLSNARRTVGDFPMHVARDESAPNAKMNQLCALAHELTKLKRSPTEGEATGLSSQQASGLSKWGKTVNIFQACHRREAIFYSRWATIFTVVVVALNALIGGAIFSSINDTDAHSLESPIRIIGGVLALSAGVLSAVRSAMRLETVSEQHASATRRFAKLYVRYNDMSQMLNIDYTVGKAKKAAEWQEWFKDYMDVMEQAPMIKDALYEKVRDEMSEKDQRIQGKEQKQIEKPQA